jgi:sugar phosphate isomerase/epimerase
VSRDVFASTSGMPRQPLAETIRECERVGLDSVELSSGAGEGDDLEFLTRTAAQIRFLVHNYFPAPAEPFVLNLADQDPGILQRSLALCEQAIDLSSRLGAPFYSLHAGFRATFDPASLGRQLRYGHVWNYGTAYSTFVQSLEHLLGYGRSREVAILVEPNVLAPFNLTNGTNEVALICEAWEVTRLMADIPDSNLGVLLDTGHLRVTAETLMFDRTEFLDEVAPFIRAFHVHDNDGSSDAHRPIAPDSWVCKVLQRAEFATLPIVDEAKFSSLAEMRDHVRWLTCTV